MQTLSFIDVLIYFSIPLLLIISFFIANYKYAWTNKKDIETISLEKFGETMFLFAIAVLLWPFVLTIIIAAFSISFTKFVLQKILPPPPVDNTSPTIIDNDAATVIVTNKRML